MVVEPPAFVKSENSITTGDNKSADQWSTIQPMTNGLSSSAGLGHVRAVVTGAAGGIGRALVAGLLASGARVLAVDMTGQGLDALRESLPAGGRDRFSAFCCDLAAEGAAQRVVDASHAALGEANALVCNAGVGRLLYSQDWLDRPPPAWEVPAQAWEKMFHINAISPILLANAFVPILRRQPWGRVVAVTTSLDSMLNAGTGPYGPSKAGLEAYMAVIGAELEGSPVSVNVLVPGGAVDTAMIPDMPGLPRSSLLQPEVMVPPLRWLLSAAANGFSQRRIRANLWDFALTPEEACAAAAAPIAWWSVAAGQRRALVRSEDASPAPSRP